MWYKFSKVKKKKVKTGKLLFLPIDFSSLLVYSNYTLITVNVFFLL